MLGLLGAAAVAVTGLGIAVRVRPPLTPEERRTRTFQKFQKACFKAVTTQRRRTFRRTDEAVQSLLAMNPDLKQLLQSDCGRTCHAYAAWRRGGRRGPKPTLEPGDGRFDNVNAHYDLRGKRRVSSWLEAVYQTVPRTRHWEDFQQRIPTLEEDVHARIAPPEETIKLQVQAQDRARCTDYAEREADKTSEPWRHW